MRQLTIKWLKKQNIPISRKCFFFKYLYIEKIDFYASRKANRFYCSARKPHRYFVEDNIYNAIKLASTCDYVFLMEQPYNRINKDIPQNVIRVKNWSEIVNKIKQLG
jgi:uncharacterized HAD superfamily protein